MFRMIVCIGFLTLGFIGVACQHHDTPRANLDSFNSQELKISPFPFDTNPEEDNKPRNPAFFEGQEKYIKAVEKAASAYPIKLSSGQIIIDNDLAFETKVQAIRSAKAGETIRMSYYIFSADESSSYLANELLKATKRGVRVKILVDLLTNAQNFDYFNSLIQESNGLLEVRYYGSVTPLILRDFVFLTKPCPAQSQPISPLECASKKWKENPSGIQSPEGFDIFAKLLFTGLVTKSPGLIQMGIIHGQELDIASLTSGNSDLKQQEQLARFLKLVYKAQFKKDLMAAIQVKLAYFLYRDQLIPIMNQIFGRIPIKQMSKSSFQDWEHLTDFHHHKLLLVGNRFIQLGGRNIENSYHLQENVFSGKYLFDDVDFQGVISFGGEKIASSFDFLWSHEDLVWTHSKLAQFGVFELLANKQEFLDSMNNCLGKLKSPSRSGFFSCFNSLPKDQIFLSEEKRNQRQAELRTHAAHRYQDGYLAKRNWDSHQALRIPLNQDDVGKVVAGYLENLHFSLLNPTKKRVFGAETKRYFLIGPEHELAYGKGIHDIWIKSLKNACDKSNQENREMLVILHSAYWLPPANLLRTFAKMMDGTWDCRNVKVKIITNSFETTDLNIINVYARYMMRAFFEHQQKIQSSLPSGSSRGAKFEFFETQAQRSRLTSLHAKVSVFGDDILIGSANMDVRSYFMDSNNGLLLTKAKDLSQGYQAWINRNLSDVSKVQNRTEFYVSEEMSLKKLKEEDTRQIEALFQKYPVFSKLSERNKKELLNLHLRLGQEIYDTTKMILSTDYIEVPFSESQYQDFIQRAQIQQEKIMYLNRLLQLL